jgi:hypothetical protein
MPKARRMVIATGQSNTPLTMFDITDMENANAEFPLQMVIQTMCDLGDWHTDSRTDVPVYGPSITPPVAGNGSRGYSHGNDDSGANGAVLTP